MDYISLSFPGVFPLLLAKSTSSASVGWKIASPGTVKFAPRRSVRRTVGAGRGALVVGVHGRRRASAREPAALRRVRVPRLGRAPVAGAGGRRVALVGVVRRIVGGRTSVTLLVVLVAGTVVVTGGRVLGLGSVAGLGRVAGVLLAGAVGLAGVVRPRRLLRPAKAH